MCYGLGEVKLDNLSPELLSKLYLEDKLTDTEIACEFGTRQVNVSKLRKKYNIPTILKSDRLGLPEELTSRQTSILIGSMLGDGRLRKTGLVTADYSEYHSEKQRSYLEWKAKEWGLFCSHIASIFDPRGYKGACLYTYSSRLLYPYWKMFYPKGGGNKEFGSLDLTLVDALSVAVWFMDDGSKTESYARFSVGSDKKSQRVQVQILNKFGIVSSLYATERQGRKDNTLIIDGRTNFSKFVDLISPHLVEGLTYKLAVKVRKAGPAPRDIITVEKVEELLARGLTSTAIAKILGVPRSSLHHHMVRLGFSSRPIGRPSKQVKKEYSLDSAESLIKALDQSLYGFEEQVFKILSTTTLPSLAISEKEAKHDWDLLLTANTKVQEGTIVGITSVGSKFCNNFFPYLFEAYHHKKLSVYAAWYNHKVLKNAIVYQIHVGDPVTPKRVFKALRLIVRAPTNFRPCVAKALTEAYCPEGGLVLDPCAGYGGRACGVKAAGRRYIGVDPHPKAKEAFERLKRYIGEFSFYNEPFEDVDLGDIQANLVLTSPPYYSVERYSQDVTQSWVRYKTWTAWIQGFLDPFVHKSWRYLEFGGCMLVNTKNVRVGRHSYPICDELKQLASSVGFILESVLDLPIGRSSKKARTEPIFVFRKPLV
jgi:hypothetical protein